MIEASDILLEARNITKRFPGVLALDNVSLEVYAGKVNAIVGENGAGKSTLMNILSGVYTQYEGDILLHGQKQSFQSSMDAQEHGIAMIHQELNLVPYLNIAENIFLGREPLNAFGCIDQKKMHRQAKAILDDLHFDIPTDTSIIDMRVGQQQMVEIAKALSVHAKVLIMDEPTSSLCESETQILFKLMRELTSKGVGIVYITHKMDEVVQLADHVTILRDGVLVEKMPMSSTTIDEIVRKMVGRDRKDFFVKRSHTYGKERLRVEHWSVRNQRNADKYILQEVHFSLHAGEVLGIYGLMGAGRTELFESLFGMYARQTQGDIYVDGEKVLIQHPEDAVEKGLALIPEDRKLDGLILDMNIEQNTTLASLKQFLRNGFLSFSKEASITDEYRDHLQIKSYSSKQLVGQLSGGNQQKVVLSKWLLTHPKVVLLDEPTRGIDIHAKNEIYKLIDDLAEEGMAIVVVSSELPEIMAVSDRIVTLCAGRITANISREDFSEERILKAALPAEKHLSSVSEPDVQRK